MNKKIFISADIEGTTGACAWEDARKGTREYERQSKIMTEEVLSVVEGFNSRWTDCEIIIKDAHATGTNLDITRFPKNCKLISGWDESPMCMMQGLDSDCDYSVLLGYHSAAGTDGAPLAHTFNPQKYARIELNGAIMSEFLVSYYTSLYFGVPVVLLSGDERICTDAMETDGQILTVAAQKGRGGSVTSILLCRTKELLMSAVGEIREKEIYRLKEIPERFHVKITYSKHQDALKSSYYPGCRKTGGRTVEFETGDYYEVLRLFVFV